MKKNISKGEDTLDNNKMMSFPIEEYPFTSVNKVSNQNFLPSDICNIIGNQ